MLASFARFLYRPDSWAAMRFAAIAALCLLLPPLAMAARIEGSVYDLGLERLDGVIVSIDTAPRQTMVSRDGRYAFEAPPGAYTINATKFEDKAPRLHTSQEIEIKGDGTFILDLILFEEVDFEEGLVPSNGFSPSLPDTAPEHSPGVIIGLAAALAVALGLLAFLKLRQRGRPEPLAEGGQSAADSQIEDFVRREGRTTQKEIYKRFPYSEAKISLLLTDLESQGKIQKIKKGRSNVIVWNKE